MRVGPLRAERWTCDGATGVAVLVHGIGLGPWFWEPWRPQFAAARIEVVALDLHTGAPATFAGLVDAVETAIAEVAAPVVLVGHSMGGLVAQVLASRGRAVALALVGSLPPGNIGVYTTPRGVRGALELAPDALAGRDVVPSWETYRDAGLADIEEHLAREVFDRIVPWPNALVRTLAWARPVVDPLAVGVPVLVALGRRDRLVWWPRARLMGDLYDGIVWRYDDLGHMPPWEPAGARMGRDVANWCAAPRRPAVIESEAFGPGEGVGHFLRRRRRGDAMKRRSAYGQKHAAR